MLVGAPVAPRKNGFGSVYWGTKNLACTLLAGRMKFRAPRHGAARWRGPLWRPEKKGLGPVFGGPRIWPVSGMLADRNLGHQAWSSAMPEADMGSRKNRFAPVFGETENQVPARRAGKTKFWALRHGAAWGRGRRGVRKKRPWPIFGGIKNLTPPRVLAERKFRGLRHRVA